MAEQLTGSELGFIGEINKNGRFDTITYGNLGWSICKMGESDAIRLSKNMIIRGIWGQAFLKEKSQIVNDPASHPNQVGTPKGHPQIKSFLGVPLKMSGKTIGMIGLANKKGGYEIADQEAVESLSVAFVEALIRKRAEMQLKATLIEKNALLKEIHHRVKNNMNVLISLLNLHCQKIKDLQSILAFQVCVRRIYSMALVHEKLYNSEDLSRVDFQDYIETLIGELIGAYDVGNHITTEINVEQISLHIETAVPLGMIINELITNAYKHAFPDNKKGKIQVQLANLIENSYELIVRDNGVGIPDDIIINKSDTLGFKLVNLLTGQIQGKIDLTIEKGTTFNIQFKGKLV